MSMETFSPQKFAEAEASGDVLVIYGPVLVRISQETLEEGVEILSAYSRHERRSVLRSVSAALDRAIEDADNDRLDDMGFKHFCDDVAIWFAEHVRLGNQGDYVVDKDDPRLGSMRVVQ